MGKRFISQKALNDYPQISSNQFIGKIMETKGGGIFVVDCPQDEQVNLVQLPSRFQKLLWVKRNSFVIIEPLYESKTKVNGEIVSVLLPKDVKYLKSNQQWPFPDVLNVDNLDHNQDKENAEDKEDKEGKEGKEDKENSDQDSLDDLFINTNRHYQESSDEESN